MVNLFIRSLARLLTPVIREAVPGVPESLRGAGYRAFIEYMTKEWQPADGDSVTAIQEFICGPYQAASEPRREG